MLEMCVFCWLGGQNDAKNSFILIVPPHSSSVMINKILNIPVVK